MSFATMSSTVGLPDLGNLIGRFPRIVWVASLTPYPAYRRRRPRPCPPLRRGDLAATSYGATVVEADPTFPLRVLLA